MAEQKQTFRFRLPWLSAQPQRPRPTSETSRAPSQPTTSVPIQRPAFRPARRAPTQPPSPQSPPPAKAEPESPPPSSSVAIESTKTSPPATADKPPSPSSAAGNARKVTSQSTSSPPRATTKPQSPSRATSESPKAISPTSSPSAATAKQVSPSSAAAESQKDTSQTASSPSSATAKPSSPPHAATESPKATSRLPSSETAKPPSPSHAAAESQVSPQPMSPSQARDQSKTTSAASSPSKGDSKSKVSSLSPSSSRAASQRQLELGKPSQPQSPSRLASQKTTSVVSSPSRKANQQEPEPTTGMVTRSPSSPDKSQTFDQTSPHEPKPEVDITSETTEKSNTRDDAMARDSTKVSSPMKATATSREATDEPVSSIATDQKPLFKAERESKETEGKKETTRETLEEEKMDKATSEEEPMQKTIIEAPGARRDTKGTLSVAHKAPRRRQKQESLERKETTAPTSYSGKQIKTVVPSQPTEGTTSTSFRKPFSFTEEEEAPLQREIKEDISKLVCSLTSGLRSGEKPITVITLTGENRGAAMQLSSKAAKKKGSIHIHRGYKTDPDESPETTTDGEVRTNGKRFNDQTALAPTAYVNSSVQNINNSIVFEVSVAERSPGVYLSFSQNTSEVIKSNGKSEFVQTRKAEFIPTPSEKLTHQPNVRRRCLRGLFMEPSDSDPDNPDKPCRHGCRYVCGERGKDKEIM